MFDPTNVGRIGKYHRGFSLFKERYYIGIERSILIKPRWYIPHIRCYYSNIGFFQFHLVFAISSYLIIDLFIDKYRDKSVEKVDKEMRRKI